MGDGRRDDRRRDVRREELVLLGEGTHAVRLPFGIGDVGAAVILLAVVVVSWWISFVNPRASNFLVEVEIELRKVTWPAVKPWLSTKAQVWASTYIVLAVVVILVIFVFVIDRVLSGLSELVFYS